MNDDGTMARVPDLVEFCNQHQLKMLTVAELIRFRLQNERYIFRVAESVMPTRFGDFRMIAYESEVDGGESHLALVRGDVNSETNQEPVLVRVHSHCLAGDVFGTTLCDCHQVVQRSLEMIAQAGRGALIYLHNTSKGFEIDRSVAPHRLFLHRSGDHSDDRHQRILRQVGLGGQILSGPQHPKDPPPLQHPHACAGATGFQPRDRRPGWPHPPQTRVSPVQILEFSRRHFSPAIFFIGLSVQILWWQGLSPDHFYRGGTP